MVERVIEICSLNVSWDYWNHEQVKRVLVVMNFHIIFHLSRQSYAHDTLLLLSYIYKFHKIM